MPLEKIPKYGTKAFVLLRFSFFVCLFVRFVCWLFFFFFFFFLLFGCVFIVFVCLFACLLACFCFS